MLAEETLELVAGRDPIHLRVQVMRERAHLTLGVLDVGQPDPGFQAELLADPKTLRFEGLIRGGRGENPGQEHAVDHDVRQAHAGKHCARVCPVPGIADPEAGQEQRDAL